MKDTELIKILKTNDGKGFHIIFKEFYVPLCVYAMRFTRDKAIAEEIIQDTFLKLWEQKEIIDQIGSLSAYLFKIVRNNCLNHIKHLQVINKYNQFYTQLLADASDYYSVTRETGQSILITREIEKQIYEAIDSLPLQCRDIFKLSRFEGLKNLEIAERKGITVNTVQKQISIALEKLREILKPLLPIILIINTYKEFSGIF